MSLRNKGLPCKRGYARVYRQVRLLGDGRAVRMWQLANRAAKNLAIFQLPFHILSEDVLETVEQDGDDS